MRISTPASAPSTGLCLVLALIKKKTGNAAELWQLHSKQRVEALTDPTEA